MKEEKEIKEEIKLFKNPTGKVWHIIGKEDDRSCHGICNSFGYWFGGYHNDKPEMTKENMPRQNWDGTQNLCRQCLSQFYKKHKLKL